MKHVASWRFCAVMFAAMPLVTSSGCAVSALSGESAAEAIHGEAAAATVVAISVASGSDESESIIHDPAWKPTRSRLAAAESVLSSPIEQNIASEIALAAGEVGAAATEESRTQLDGASSGRCCPHCICDGECKCDYPGECLVKRDGGKRSWVKHTSGSGVCYVSPEHYQEISKPAKAIPPAASSPVYFEKYPEPASRSAPVRIEREPMAIQQSCPNGKCSLRTVQPIRRFFR